MIPNLPGWLAWHANAKGRRVPGWTRHVPAQLPAAEPTPGADVPGSPGATRPDFDTVRRYVKR